MPPFVAYHGATAEDHQARVDELAPQGFRPISLSVSGDPDDARYTAVWVQRPGPAWWAVHGLSSGEYQARFDELTGAGYAPVVVSATGPAERTRFTALFEQEVTSPWFARHGLRWDPPDELDTITHENARAFRDGFVPRCLAVYGTPEDRRFAGVWIKNDAPVAWSWWWADRGTYQKFFDAEVQGGLRPAWVSVAPDWWHLAVFRDDQIGDWSARHGITAEQYQAEFDTRVAADLMPIVVQAGGAGANTRYASVFARTEFPLPRRWTVTGTSMPSVTEFDNLVRGFMAAHAIRAGSVAMVRDGEVVLSRGYTWAEESYPITQPDGLFRVASLSKIFTAAAIDRLVSTGRLRWDTAAYPFLGITSAALADQHPDPAVNTITVRQLVLHTSGLKFARVTENGIERTFEPASDLRTVAARLALTTTPSRHDVVRYMYGERLEFPPGTDCSPFEPRCYSNFGYVLLTSIVEAASGSSYLDYLRSEILQLEGLTDVYIGATAASGRRSGEVSYDHPSVSLSMLQPTANVMAPNTYGGAFTLENGEGSGGLVTSAPTVARFISQHAVWEFGGRKDRLRLCVQPASH
jgi:CubicO group peptidase (beta-lactamase class C family)